MFTMLLNAKIEDNAAIKSLTWTVKPLHFQLPSSYITFHLEIQNTQILLIRIHYCLSYVLHSQEEQRCLMLEEKRQREQEFLRTEPLEPEMRQRLECESNEPPQNGFSPDSLVCVQ